jgi:hydrogenase expression/formation protein HypD
MKYLTEFRNNEIALKIINRINSKEYPSSSIMEFCGGHTIAIFKSGIRDILPKNVRLSSGPGCPVCVTSNSDIDKAGEYAKLPDVILTTYGDMMKVPGSYANLLQLRSEGYDIRVVYSTLDAVKIAENNPQKHVIFFGIGFETTAPTLAASILSAKERGIKNFYVISVLKLTIPAIKALLELGEVKINGVIGPGHVSTIIGSDPWRILPDKFNIPCVLTGFEPLDILQGIELLLLKIKEGKPELLNQYSRSVKPEGNIIARKIMDQVFEVVDSDWRGFGVIPQSGLKINKKFEEFDAEKKFNVTLNPIMENLNCHCGEVLRGIISPNECALFREVCNPENPMGPCMVSSEGTCAAYYHFYIDN